MILRYIHYFLAVAEYGSFTRAAQALYVSQPALSQQIKLLEQDLAVQLFDRSGRTIRLTEAGRVYQQYASQALRELEAGKRALHNVQDLTRGNLRLALTPTYTPWLAGPLMARFWQRYPGITLTINEATQEQIERQLLADELDVGLGYQCDNAAEISATPFMTESLSLIVNNRHPLASRHQISLSELGDQPLILLDSGFATRKQIDAQLRTLSISANIVAETNTIGVILAFIQHAPVAALMPDSLIQPDDHLTAVKITPAFAERTGMIFMRRDSTHAATHAFSQLLKEILLQRKENH